MNWTIEGKVSHLTFDPSSTEIKFSIRALTDYRVKHGDCIYNIFIERTNAANPLISPKCMLFREEQQFTFIDTYGRSRVPMQDHSIQFVFNDKNGYPFELEHFTVRY